MRKIVIAVIVLLLIVLGIMAVSKGISIGSIKVASISDLSEKNEKIDKKIEEINTLIDTDYPKKLTELNTAGKNMQDAKEEYLKYSTISTNDEIIKAMQGKVYKIEFLWTKLGQHVRNEGVVLDFKINESSIGESKASDLEFTVTGTYSRITNFVYALENDADLDFRIDNFKLLPNSSDVLLIATFTVRNVVIEGNTSVLEVYSNENATKTTNQTNTTNSSSSNNKSENTSTQNANEQNTNTQSTNTQNANEQNTNTQNTNTQNTSTQDLNTQSSNTQSTDTNTQNTNTANSVN